MPTNDGRDTGPGRRRPLTLRRTTGALALAAAVVAALLQGGVAAAATTTTTATTASDLGPNVVVFDPSMPQAEIQARLDQIAAQQLDNQFGTQRYAVLFQPGTYGTPETPLNFQVGYYTTVAGLGRNPDDTTINGSVDVFNQCSTDDQGNQSCTALNNFWRSLSNLHIAVANTGSCTNTEFWAVSQAAPMRRVHVTGGSGNQVSFMDYCSAGPQYASGGFLADSAFDGPAGTVNGSQQQFYVRNTVLGGGWSNGVWNQVFSGDPGAPAQDFGQPTTTTNPDGSTTTTNHPYTTLATTPVTKEEPYLFTDQTGALRVFVPIAQRNTSGTTWANGTTPGSALKLSDFYVATPSSSIATINAKLAAGKDLLLTPGVYDVPQSIRVTRPGQVVLGLGMATLTARNGAVPLVVSDVPGVDVAGLIVDAGPTNSPALVQLGAPRPTRTATAAAGPRNTSVQPTALQDVFFRIGGPHAGKATDALVVNSDDVVLDDIWAWRADHGTGVGWQKNTSDSGLVVNGDDVTATGLFVEHFQKYDVVWNGQNGRTIFFQNEMPYDPPSQKAWSHDGENGYAAYEIAPQVASHEAWGLGSYIYTNKVPTLHATNAFEVPVTPGVQMHDLLTISLNKAGTIDHVINGVGNAVTPDHQGPETVVSYPGS